MHAYMSLLPYRYCGILFYQVKFKFCRLQVPIDSTAVMLSSGVSSVVYRNARAMLQKALGVCSTASSRDLCVQFGCARIELPVRTTLSTFKEKYLQRLAPGDRAAANLANPIYLAAVFSLVARKQKVKIARERLLTTLGLTSVELHRSVNLVADIVPELVGIEEKKNAKSEKTKKRKSSEDNDSEEKEENDENEEKKGNDDVGDEEDEDKEKKQKKTSPGKKSQPKKALTEKKLRQAVLAYAANDMPVGKTLDNHNKKATTAVVTAQAQPRVTRSAAAAGGPVQAAY